MTGDEGRAPRVPFDRVSWGVIGAVVAGTFAIWMLFFPDFIAGRFVDPDGTGLVDVDMPQVRCLLGCVGRDRAAVGGT